MFIKKIDKKNANGKVYTSFRLCESIRIGNKPRHHILLNLGALEGVSSDEKKELSNHIEYLYLGQTPLFDPVSDKVKTLAVRFYKKLRDKYKEEKDRPISIGENHDLQEPIITDFETVDINSIEHDEVREIGAEWLCMQAIQELGIAALLASQNWNDEQINKALTLLISRAVYPASEHKTSQWLDSSSAVTRIVFGQQRSISHQQLYKVGDMLYEQQELLTKHLSTKTNDLFHLNDKIIFYDLTNTYFEGRKVKSKLSQYGRSKEKRSDAKLVSLALVVNGEGFVKYSKIYEGNIFEGHTLLATIESLSANTNAIKPLIVMDAGIATEENLNLLKEKGYDYLCVSRAKLKDYKVAAPETAAIEISDKRNHKIELQMVVKEGATDQYMYIRSEMKAVKEASMEAHYSKRFEQELEQLAKTIHTKNGTKTVKAVCERLGRIKERYPSANKHYKIEIKEKNKIVTLITFSKIPPATHTNTHGVYFLRTSLKENDEKIIWTIYNTLTEIEATFRTLKTDLHLRPVYHQKDSRTEAHIHLGVLAYMVVNTIRYKLKQNGIQHDWSNIVRIMNTQKLVTTSIKNTNNQIIIIEKCSQPNEQVLEIYNATKYKSTPFKIKKHVVPQ